MKRLILLAAVAGLAAGVALNGCDKRPPPATPQTNAAKQTIDNVTKSAQQSTDSGAAATRQAIDQSETDGKAAEGENK